MLKNGTIDFIGSTAETLEHYLNDGIDIQQGKIVERIKFTKNTLQIYAITINGTDDTFSTIKNGQEFIEVTISGHTDENMSYDIMVILKNKDGMPYATFARGHYEGDILHQGPGDFWISKRIQLPRILTKGIIHADLYIHHPMVEYYLQAPNCCTLDSEGYQAGFGTAMNQETNGFIGLDEA